MAQQQQMQGLPNASPVDQALAAWRVDSTVGKLLDLLRAVMASNLALHSPIFNQLVEAAQSMRGMQNISMQEKELAMYFLLDLVEEQDDPRSLQDNKPDPALLRVMATLSDDMLGLQHIISVKWWLMYIFNHADPECSVTDFLENGGAGRPLKDLFAVAVPPAQTGTPIDNHMVADPIRQTRYYYALGLVIHSLNDFVIARRALRRALKQAVTANGAIVNLRRGPRLEVDWLFVKSALRIHLALALLNLGEIFGAVGLMSQVAAEEAGCRDIHPELGEGYRNFLNHLAFTPDFTPVELRIVLNMGGQMFAKHSFAFSSMIRAQALALNGVVKFQEALSLIRIAVEYLEGHYANLHIGMPEGAFKTLMGNALHQLYHTRYMLVRHYTPDLTAAGLFQAQMELLRAYSALGIEIRDELYDECLIQVVHSLREQSKRSSDHLLAWAIFDAAMQLLCNDGPHGGFFHHHSTLDPVIASLFESRSRAAFGRGKLRDSVWFLMRSLFCEKKFGMNHPRDESLEREMVNIMERSSVAALLTSPRYRPFFCVYQEAMDYFRQPMIAQEGEDLQRKHGRQQGYYQRQEGTVPSLMRMSFEAAFPGWLVDWFYSAVQMWVTQILTYYICIYAGMRHRMHLLRDLLAHDEVEQSFGQLTSFQPNP
jgi:tetratricopeptide (TPR) repeat protein